MNDPFEAAPAFDRPNEEQIRESHLRMIVAEVEKQFPSSPREIRDSEIEARRVTFPAFRDLLVQPSTWQNAPAKLQKDLSVTYGTICFGGSGNNMLMWSHYADSLRGYVIEFDSEHPLFRNARKVKYSTERPRVKYQENAPEAFYLCKSSQWCYEDESRMFLPLANAPSVGIDKYGAPLHLWEFDPAAVKSIILGERIQDDARRAIVDAYSKDYRRHARLKFASRHESEFRIVIDDILKT
ncbi:MAG TPA: DUF2971 domain-containing protein [Lacunisphaera sp.]|nr:DUF2971 domain-containing protein [Lacunisphaera sp.]